uniref:Putative E3 ubiquitin-protein ligase ARI7 isoform X2 n=1 Tax=Rhizophora mucronata TaxID=61149 RepID=A0A2P2LQM9_RHIMU
MHMDIIYLSMNMPRDNSLSICKVRQSLDWKGFINVQKRNCNSSSLLMVHQENLMSSEQS